MENNAKKRMSAKAAKEAREKAISEYEKVDCFQKPEKGVDSGAWGKIAELSSVDGKSRKSKVSAKGKVDVKNGNLTVEVKTNGGEVDGIIKAVNKNQRLAVVYSLHVCNSNTKGKLREIPQIILKAADFLDLLTSCGALRTGKKKTNGGTCSAIEPSSKKLFDALQAGIENGLYTLYNPEKRYTYEAL